jgi:hypothetical protein
MEAPMQTQIMVRDEITSRLGRPEFVFTLSLPAERLTVRDLIRARVLHEVQAYNAKQAEHFYGLVQPVGAERTARGYRLAQPRPIDAAEQCAQAVAAFEQNGFVLLLDDRQVDDLEAVVEVAPETSVTFLKLVPLVGG